MKHIIIPVTDAGMAIANSISSAIDHSVIVRHKDFSIADAQNASSLIFIGAMGICVRTIAPMLKNKYADPAVICIDSSGKFVISVASGHIGGANELTNRVASIIGAQPVITTQSDNAGLWTLDTIGKKYGWKTDARKHDLNEAIFRFVNSEPTALLTDVTSDAVRKLESEAPSHVEIFHKFEDIDTSKFRLIIAVTPYTYDSPIPILYYRPSVINIGVGCRKNCNPEGVSEHIDNFIVDKRLSPLSIKTVATIDIKQDEPMIKEIAEHWGAEIIAFNGTELESIPVPNPSEKVHSVTGSWGVAESAAIKASGFGSLVIEKQKCKLSDNNDFTFAAAIDSSATKSGHIEIVGAGPGDPELVSVRGKRFLENADLILYAGSLVPRELTYYAKPGCTVRSSADMTLEQQFELMKEFYDRGLLVVRLHTGDPCIYGAIQEQMSYFDRAGMSYHITPGISSFQAAAAALRSQFTIPERVQTIILTRGEGRTPMPEKEQLHKLAQSQSTMCIYLSAAVVEKVQEELLMAYSPETSVAACYKLTWKEERIYRGKLRDLAKIVRDNNLTLTTLLVVGNAIDNRSGESRLYSHEFKHLFRP